jgi:hypothetical protein
MYMNPVLGIQLSVAIRQIDKHVSLYSGNSSITAKVHFPPMCVWFRWMPPFGVNLCRPQSEDNTIAQVLGRKDAVYRAIFN